MEKRLILAVLLMSAVILITNLLFPPAPPPEPGDQAADSARVVVPPAAPLALPAPAAARADTVVVSSPLYRYAVSTRGGALVGAELKQYPSYVHDGTFVQLVPEGTQDFLTHRAVVGNDTLDLRALPFRASASTLELGAGQESKELRLTYTGANGFGAELVYTFRPDRYVVGVRGRLFGLNGAGAVLLTDIGPAIAPHEAPDHRSEAQLSLVARSTDGSLERLPLLKVEGRDSLPGPLTWVGLRDKYFLAALIAGDKSAFQGAAARELPTLRLPRSGAPDDPIELPRAEVTARVPVTSDGTFAFDAYLGPQEYDRLAAVGYELEEVTPYAYAWLQPIIRPFAAAILWVLAFLHDTLGVAYGWVLIIFGVLMRIVLWPLNAKAMRSQMKNMTVQPLMQERMQKIREKYKDDPQRQQQEMIAMYQELGVNPLSMVGGGCLPLLIPFPVLITLFFVFQNSIVFRGAEFLWLPDLSLRDPFYILPVFLVVSMFALQWVSTHLSGMEQNPQMKMMMYFMPLMMGVLFFNLPAGLNLYYATTNVATLPQQVLIAKERRKVQETMKASGPGRAPASAARSRGGGGKQSGQRSTKRRG